MKKKKIELRTIEVIKWKTSDGQVFDSKREAEEHEKEEMIYTEINNMLIETGSDVLEVDDAAEVIAGYWRQIKTILNKY